MTNAYMPYRTTAPAGARPAPYYYIALAAIGVLLTGCAGVMRTVAGPAPAPAEAGPAYPTALPPVATVTGPLAVRVIYPRAGATITSRDSNFIFGSVGSGDAALRINGAEVPVLANGSFIAYLPLPPQDAPAYELVAARGADTARVTHPVVLLPPRPVFGDSAGTPFVDSTTVAPRGNLFLPDDEPVRVSVRAAAGAAAWVAFADGSRRALFHGRPMTVVPSARGDSLADTLARYGDPERWSTDVPARLLRTPATLVVARGSDTARFPIARVSPLDSLASRLWVIGARTTAAVSDTDRVIVGRPVTAGTYKWFFLPGTTVEATGRSGDALRVRLDRALEAWVGIEDASPLPAEAPAPRRTLTAIRVIPNADWVDVRFATGERPPYLVEESGNRVIVTLYGTTAATDAIRHVANDSLVRYATWEPETGDRARVTLHLADAPFGWIAFWDDQLGVFNLRLRRTPRVEGGRRDPLRGLTIAVDAGHPPIGATGPSGLWEPTLTLPIAEKLKTALEERGATVVMTRTTAAPVALGDRPIMARRANAHAFVSIHLNALPDGVNPFRAHGTETYFFHPHAEPLARLVQRGMVRHLGLRDLGAHYGNLAIARTSWMPSVLCEGAFLMMPEQEAALATDEFQWRYARGVAEGIEAYFKSLGTRR